MSRRFFALSIKSKIVGLVLGSALISVGCTALVLVHIQDSQEAQIQRAATAVADVYGGLVQEYLDDVLGTLETVVAAPSIRAPLALDLVRPELRGVPEDAEPERRALLLGEFNALPRFEAVLMTTPERNIYLAEPYAVQLAFGSPSLAGTAALERAITTGEVSWGGVQVSHVTGGPVLVVLVPIKDDAGAVRSVVANAVRLDALAEMAHRVKMGTTGSLMLFDSAGVPLVYPDAQRIASMQPLVELPLVASALAGRPGSYSYHNPVTDRDEIGVISAVENGTFYVAVTQSQAEAFGEIRQTMMALFLVLGAAAFLLLTSGLLFARSLARGLAIVERAAIGLAAGDPDQEVGIRSNDELGRMATAFRGMITYYKRMANLADAVAGGDLTQEVHPQSSRDRLGSALESMVTNLRTLVARLEALAFRDELTRLPNRAVFLEKLEAGMLRTRREGSLLAVLFMDLDGFKAVNDSLGHQGGDQVLIKIAERLHGCLRPSDTVCRLGGDEFTILLEGQVDVGLARRVAEDVLERVALPISVGDQEVSISGSVGVAFGPGSYATPVELLRAADTALYTAKKSGKAQVAILDSDRGSLLSPQLRIERVA